MIEVLGGLGPYAHRDRRTYKDRFSVEDAVGNTPLGLFVEGLGQHFRKSKEGFAKHFARKYFGPPPIWIEAAAWGWGNLTHIVANAADRRFNAGFA